METPFRLEHTEPDQVYKTNDPNLPEEEECIEYDYYEVNVEKTLSTSVFIRVLKGTEFKKMDRNEMDKIITKAVSETVSSYDWDDPWNNEFEIGCINQITEKVAAEFNTYEYN